MTSPGGDIPEGAYVGTAGQSNSITDLNNLTEAEAKRRMQAPIGPSFAGQRDGVWGFFSLITGVVQGVVDVVVGGVTAIVDGIGQIFNAVGSLFGAARVDTAAVDAARVAGENAIVANMSASLEYLDEIQRVGGAYMDRPRYSMVGGYLKPHPLPMGGPSAPYYGSFPLAQGTFWHPPLGDWGGRVDDHIFADNDAARGFLAQAGGTLELIESGLWMIYFQVAVLQGASTETAPADLWCYVTSQKDYVPVGSPMSGMDSYNRITGNKSTNDAHGFGAIHTFGRAGQYLGSRDSTQGGGNTVSGYMMCYLDSPGWFIHLANTGARHFGGAASTFVFAQKVNSENLRAEIEDLKTQIAAALPGQSTDKLLDEASIAAMVAEVGNLEVPDVVVPTDPPEAGNG